MSRATLTRETGWSVEWLGKAPRRWRTSRLRFLVKVNPSRSELSCVSRDTEVSFVPMEAVGEYGGLQLDQTKPLDEVSVGYTYFREDDVVVAKITPCFENGKGSMAQGLRNGVAFGTTELHVLRPLPGLDPKFLFYLTISHPFRSIGTAYMYGAGGQKRVPDEFVRDFRHPFPVIAEQRAITAFLDRETARIDALIEKKQRQIELLKEKRTALISHAVTKGLDPDVKMKNSGIEWLGEIPEHWDVAKLARIAVNLQTGPFGTQLHASDYVENGIPVVNPANLQSGDIVPDPRCTVSKETFGNLRRHRLDEGDIVFGRRGEMGRCALVTRSADGFLCGTGSIRIRLNLEKADPLYTSFFLRIPAVRDHLLLDCVGTTMDNLNTGIIARIPVAVPPVDEQSAIASQLLAGFEPIKRIVSAIRQSMETLLEYRTALISAAVTGKIDVRKEVAE